MFVYLYVCADRNGGRQLISTPRKSSCKMTCKKPGCNQEFKARSYKKDNGLWVVTTVPHCRCLPLLPEERRQRSIPIKFIPLPVEKAVKGTVTTTGGTSQVKQVIGNVQRHTGKLLNYQQARTMLKGPAASAKAGHFKEFLKVGGKKGMKEGRYEERHGVRDEQR